MSDQPHNAWDAALRTIKKLRAHGYTAMLAGGCVRDRLLGRTPKDYDVVTNATPEQVGRVFPRARKVGAKFGVMLVRKFGPEIEVATFRTDGPYSDGRHPDAIAFGSEEQDARRRDFTINGLFFDPVDERVIDHIGGRADLEAGIIKTIGDPECRFSEDHLRMLRAVRFAARLGFRIDSGTKDAIRRSAHCLPDISAERIWMELEMILTDPTRATGWSLLVETGLRDHLISEWTSTDGNDTTIHARLDALPPHPVAPSLALAAVVCGSAPGTAAVICRALRLSNRLTHAVTWVVHSLSQVRDQSSLELADLKLLMAEDAWPELVELLRVDLIATNGDVAEHQRLCQRADVIAPEDVAPPPLLSGDDLTEMGMSPGPRMGELLATVYRAQLNRQISTLEGAMAMARRLIES